MRKNLESKVSMVLVATLLLLGGCGKSDKGKVSISVGNWPDENSSSAPQFNAFKERFNEEYPDIDLQPDYGDSSFKTFMTRGVANQLPGIQSLPFTEIDKVGKSGFVLELKKELEKRGYIDALDDNILDLITTKEGKIYAIPFNTYKLGLCINGKLFREAGLVNSDGSIKYPTTYEELAEFADTIRQKTGKAGFIMQTMNNCGGWLFMPIAWSYGVNFVTQKGDKWVATFDSPEMVNALQYVYDLKWKYDLLPDNALIDTNECERLFAANEGAMYIAAPVENVLVKKYAMDKNDIYWGALPKGPKGRYTLLGGSFWIVNANYDAKQIDAIFNWLKIRGATPSVDENTIESWENQLKLLVESNSIVSPYDLSSIWKSDGERSKQYSEIRKKYANVDGKNFENYVNAKNITLRAEEAVACQELYAILDAGLQSILTNKDVNIEELAKQMNSDFQKNSLDELEEN